MSESHNGDAPLLLRRAKYGSGIPGILSVARRLLTWTPSDPGSGQPKIEVAVAVIKSELNLTPSIAYQLPVAAHMLHVKRRHTRAFPVLC